MIAHQTEIRISSLRFSRVRWKRQRRCIIYYLALMWQGRCCCRIIVMTPEISKKML